jgi:hypothetical protein
LRRRKVRSSIAARSQRNDATPAAADAAAEGLFQRELRGNLEFVGNLPDTAQHRRRAAGEDRLRRCSAAQRVGHESSLAARSVVGRQNQLAAHVSEALRFDEQFGRASAVKEPYARSSREQCLRAQPDRCNPDTAGYDRNIALVPRAIEAVTQCADDVEARTGR